MLQQNDFLSNYVASFQELRTSEELFDVTLACEDKNVEDHKVVMSACSPFFRHIFSKTKQNHPFIYLKGVLHKDLVALLDYIYTGETQVPAQDVNRFIDAARDLKIKGLAEVDDVLENKYETGLFRDGKENNDNPEESMETTVSHYMELDRQNKSKEKNKSNISFKIKQEPVKNEVQEQFHIEISKKMEKVEDSENGLMWKCTECTKMFKKKDKMQLHVETHLEGFSHNCFHCDKAYKTRGVLYTHMSKRHRGVK